MSTSFSFDGQIRSDALLRLLLFQLYSVSIVGSGSIAQRPQHCCAWLRLDCWCSHALLMALLLRPNSPVLRFNSPVLRSNSPLLCPHVQQMLLLATHELGHSCEGCVCTARRRDEL